MDRSIIRNAGLSVVLCAGLGFGGLAMAQNAFAAETEDEAAATETEAKANEKEATEDKAADEKDAATDEKATDEKDAEKTDEKTDEAADADKAEAGALADGEYKASGKGIGGDVPVTVTIKDGAIESVEVGDNSETQGIGSNAIEQLPEQFVGLKTAEEVDALDGVSGATITSNALKDAVSDCLEQASAGDAEKTDEAADEKADDKADEKADAEKTDEAADEKADEKADTTDEADADADTEADAAEAVEK